MFISPAYAQAMDTASSMDGGQGGVTGFIGPLVPVVLIFFIFYVMVIRPQNKRMQDHRANVDKLQKGDKVVTGGGIVATVRKTVGDDEIELEIAPGVIVTALRSTLMSVRGTKASS